MSKFLALIEARADFYLGYSLFIDYLEINFWGPPPAKKVFPAEKAQLQYESALPTHSCY